jgi:excisionase family DNA binding protein
MIKDTFEKRAFTIAEAAEYCCVSRGIVENWLTKGLIRYEELPGTGNKQRFRRIRKIDLDTFLDQNLCANKETKQIKGEKEFTGIFLRPKSA